SAGVEPRCDRDHRPRICGVGTQRSVLGVGQGGARQPDPSLTQNAVRLGGLSTLRQPPDRAVVACENSLSGAFPRGFARADTGGFFPLLLLPALGGATRTCT